MTAILDKQGSVFDHNEFREEKPLEIMVSRAQIAQDELVKFSADAVHRVMVEKALIYVFEGKNAQDMLHNSAKETIESVLRSIRGLLGKDLDLHEEDIALLSSHSDENGGISKHAIYAFTDALFETAAITSLSSHVPTSMIEAHNDAQNKMTQHLDWHQHQLTDVIEHGKILKDGSHLILDDEQKTVVARHNQLITDWRDGLSQQYPQSVEFTHIANQANISHPHIEGVTQHPLMTAVQGMHEAVKRLQFARIKDDLEHDTFIIKQPEAHIISLFEKGIKSPASIEEKIQTVHEGQYFDAQDRPKINDAARDKIIVNDIETLERLTHHSTNIIAQRDDVTLKKAKLRMTGQGEWHAGLIIEFELKDHNGRAFSFPTEYFFSDVKQHEIEQISHSIYNCIKLVKDQGAKSSRNNIGDRNLNDISVAEAKEFVRQYNHIADWLNEQHGSKMDYFLKSHDFEIYQKEFSKKKIIDNTKYVLKATQTSQRNYHTIMEALDELEVNATIMEPLDTEKTDRLFKESSDISGNIGSAGSALIALKSEELRSMHRFVKASAAKSHMYESYDKYNGSDPTMSALYSVLTDDNNPLKEKTKIERSKQIADMPEHIFIPALGVDFEMEHLKEAQQFIEKFNEMTKPLLTQRNISRVR